jgi:hypothetical protein
MNQTNLKLQPGISTVETKGDSVKLLSLLALATGAVAMPQTSHADIVFTDLSANPIHVGPQGSSSYVINTLPGAAQLGFHAHTVGTTVGSSRWITGRQQAGYLRLKTVASSFNMVGPGKTWNMLAASTAPAAFGGAANDQSQVLPASYNDKYLLFRFQDSTQPGNPFRYGWVELSLANPPGGVGPDIAIERYAYDTSGAFLASGQVPEPSAPALLALGALTLGAKGLRSWRKNRPSATKP